MDYATPAQLKQVIGLIDEKKVTEKQLTLLLRSGLLADLFDADLADPKVRISRSTFRRLIGTSPDSLRAVLTYGNPYRTEDLLAHVRHEDSMINSKTFPFRKRRTATMEFVGFDHPVRLDEALALGRGMRLEPPVYEDAMMVADAFLSLAAWGNEKIVFPHEPVRVYDGGDIRRILVISNGELYADLAGSEWDRRWHFGFIAKRHGDYYPLS